MVDSVRKVGMSWARRRQGRPKRRATQRTCAAAAAAQRARVERVSSGDVRYEADARLAKPWSPSAEFRTNNGVLLSRLR